MLEPPLAGLTNSGQPSSAIASSTRLRSTGPACSRPALGRRAAGQSRSLTTTYGPTGSPLAREDQLHVLLVHADRAGQHARPDVRDAGHLQQALDGAVLAVRAVQHRQHHVDLAEQVRYLRRARWRCQRGPRLPAQGTTGEPGSATASTDGSCAAGDREPGRLVGDLHPAALAW